MINLSFQLIKKKNRTFDLAISASRSPFYTDIQNYETFKSSRVYYPKSKMFIHDKKTYC